VNREPPRVVFDCVIFTQALINPKGPAGACVKAAESGDCVLHVSPFVFQEIRELPDKLPIRHQITPERVESLIQQISEYAIVITQVPDRYTHPIDPKDSAYVNLALATNAQLIVSRDHHLLVVQAAVPKTAHRQTCRIPEGT
jgi:putative PIN family toxin of toxin-antitoxin system